MGRQAKRRFTLPGSLNASDAPPIVGTSYNLRTLSRFFKMGVIARPFEMPLERARRFHLPWLQIRSKRDDFGAHLFGDK